MTNSARAAYEKLTTIAANDLKGDAVSAGIATVVAQGLSFLEKTPTHELVSDDRSKRYFCFEARGVKSRPINAGLFDVTAARTNCKRVLDCDVEGLSTDLLGKSLYTIAISYCAAADLLSKGGDR